MNTQALDKLDSRSKLEKEFDKYNIATTPQTIPTLDLIKLIGILQNERNAWRNNALEWEKKNQALFKELVEVREKCCADLFESIESCESIEQSSRQATSEINSTALSQTEPLTKKKWWHFLKHNK